MKIKPPFLFVAFMFLFPLLKGTPQTSLLKSSAKADCMHFTGDSGDTLYLGMNFNNMGFWKLASIPQHQSQPGMFPEAEYYGELITGFNRAKLSWYIIDPLFYDTTGNLRPRNIDLDELSKNLVRPVLETEIFPGEEMPNGKAYNIPVFNLAYYPSERGDYNFDVEGIPGISAGIDSEGTLKEPESRWGGIMRKIEHYQAETLMPVSLQFWLMDPFMDGLQTGGDLYFNYGDISEDVMQDGSMFFEQGLNNPQIPSGNANSIWGSVPATLYPENYNFNYTSGSRIYQDVGLDGLGFPYENNFFNEAYIERIHDLFGSSLAFIKAVADPSADNFHYFRGSDYDDDPKYESVIERYKHFNGSEGNSPTDSQNPEPYPTSATSIPDTEDLNYDQQLNEEENYYQYKIHLESGQMQVGQSFIDEIYHATGIDLPNGGKTETTWYHFTIPLEEYTDAFGNVPSFDSCYFMRMFLKGFSESVVLRFASLEMIRIKENPVYFGIDVFPNPADTRLKVEFDEIVIKPFEVSLTDMLGRTALRKTIAAEALPGFWLDVSNLKTGLYVLRIATPDFDRVEKIYIQ